MSIFAELKRRSVLKVGATYLVIAWLSIQAASILFPAFEAPPWALRIFVLVMFIGFPIALIMAWVFEVGGGGVRVEGSARDDLKFYGLIGAIAALSFGWYHYGQPAVRPEVQAEQRSVAVLPFENMSGDAENEFFSDGISEEILNALAQMPELKVAARTSSFSFKGQQREIPDIARELEVRMVLEGSVRKQGQRVRITAQLIDATNGFHVWSQTYDRDLKDIFAIQDEIARAIADQLKVKLGVAQAAAVGPDTDDIEAYELYLKGMQKWQARGEANIREADRLLRAALARDPDFAKAWAGLAVTWVVLPEWSLEPRVDAWLTARDAAEHAIALDPSLPESYAALGYIALSEFRFATGRAMFARAHEVAPSYATGWQWHGEGLMVEGAREEAVEATRKARELDPKSAVVSQAYANQLWQLGRDDEALAVCDAVTETHKDWESCQLLRAGHAMLRGDLALARIELGQLAARRGAESERLMDALVDAIEKGQPARPLAERLAAATDGTADPTSIAPLADADAILWLLRLGHPDLALRRLETQAMRLPSYARSTLFDPHLAALHCQPGMRALATRLQVPAAHTEAMCAQSRTRT
jgi:adenylate cyclase